MASEFEFRVWTESSDLVHAGTDREEALTALGEAIQEHRWSEHCRGCGVLTPPEFHGFSIQVCRGGQDVAGDPTL